jgi:nucleotide-binding universal stress UspA family protein
MPIRDVLLQIDSYPEATSLEAIEQAARFTAAIGGVLSGLAVEVEIRVPRNRLADYLIGLSRLAEDEEQKSRHACQSALAAFSARAKAAGVLGEALRGRSDLYCIGDFVAERARARDLCLVPIADPLDGQRSVAEAVVFGSGRPVLLFRPGRADLPSGGVSTVVLAWDGSRSAARAMADALPVMLKAREVRVLTVVNEKPDARSGLGDDAARHLKAHGVNAVVDEVDASGRRIGQVFDDYVAKCGSDLLVMGAYGSSRVREFILGGATEHMLHDPKVALFLSH